jgi:putative FmdB family regulatory protein
MRECQCGVSVWIYLGQMPIYEYLCPDGHRFEVVQRFSDDPVTVCEVCGKPVQRVLFAPAVHYKGKGFYSTDYGRKGANGAKPESGGGSETSSKESGSDSGSSDSGSKSESKGSESKGSESKSSDSKSSDSGSKGSSGERSSTKSDSSSKPAA